MTALRASAVAALTVAAAIGAPPAARADEKQACVAAYEKAQHLRMDTKLRAAKEQLVVCSRPECPVIIRQDCVQWMGEVNASMPSVVIAARDTSGHDVLDVRVTVDGVVVMEQLDGKPISIDPGPHKLRYLTRGKPPVDEQILVREGEHNRPLTVTFGPSPQPGPTGATTATPRTDAPAADADEPAGKGGAPIVPIVLIGVGAVALGAALYFDLKANGDAQTLRDVCAPNCRQSDVDAVQAKYVAAGVALGVGIVGVGLGVTLLVLRPSAPKKTEARGWTVDVAPTPGGATAGLRAAF
jgi:hypothetical protein